MGLLQDGYTVFIGVRKHEDGEKLKSWAAKNNLGEKRWEDEDW